MYPNCLIILLISERSAKNSDSVLFDCKSKKDEVATTNYGLNFTSIISKGNIYGVQFHPEKSSLQGLRLLKNFINL